MTHSTSLIQVGSKAHVEGQTTQHEANEHQDLQCQPSNDDAVTDEDIFWFGQQPGAARLDIETDPIARDEDDCCPARSNERESVPLYSSNETREYHVLRCGEENRR